MHPPNDCRPPDARKTIAASRPEIDEVGGSAANCRSRMWHGHDPAIAVVRRKPSAPRPRPQSLQERQLLNPAQTAFDAVCRQVSPDTSCAVSPVAGKKACLHLLAFGLVASGYGAAGSFSRRSPTDTRQSRRIAMHRADVPMLRNEGEPHEPHVPSFAKKAVTWQENFRLGVPHLGHLEDAV
jgi:hypothetical protein